MGPLADHAFAARPLIPIAIGATIALAVAGGLAVRRFLLELPPDVLDERCAPRSAARRALRMIFGLALIALGVALLVLPGPGVLLIALGLLVCAPRRLMRWTATLPRVLRAINAFRRRHGRPDLAAGACRAGQGPARVLRRDRRSAGHLRGRKGRCDRRRRSRSRRERGARCFDERRALRQVSRPR